MANVAFPERTSQLKTSDAPRNDPLRPQARDWVLAHEALTRLAKSRAQHEWEEGWALLSALRAGVHRHLGFASFAQYVGELFGYRPRSVEEKLRVAEALQSLPILSNDLRTGALTWSVVRELTRVATRETESAWREMAHGKSARDIEHCVSGRKPGDTPDSPADPALRRHFLSFEVRAETLATCREALAKLRRDTGGPLDDDAALLLMARQVLAGPADTGRANYQIALTVCERCRRSFQHGRGEPFELEPNVAEMARCDAQYLGRVDSVPAEDRDGDYSTPKSTPLEDDTRAFVSSHDAAQHIDAHVGEPPNGIACSHDAHVGEPPNSVACSHGAHVGEPRDNDARASDDLPHPGARMAAAPTPSRARRGENPSAPSVPPRTSNTKGLLVRATQTIPPATRRRVLRRDNARCVVPGCRHATFLDVHHLELRSEGGRHDPDSLIVLCAAHHRAIHRGALIVEGRRAQDVAFRHADGSPYLGALSPRTVAARTRAFAALRQLGFREGDVRRALDALRNEAELDADDPQQVVRAALRLLTPSLQSAS